MRSSPPRILVTRSPHQASELADALRALGAEPVLIPTIETVEPTSYAPLDEALARLDGFDWLIFTSANAVEAFARRLDGRALPVGLKIAAIGAATARALEAAGFGVDLVPALAVAESLTEALLPFALQPDGDAYAVSSVFGRKKRGSICPRLCARRGRKLPWPRLTRR